MNLLKKITFHHFRNTSIVFLIALAILYFSIDWVIISEVNEQLQITNKHVEDKLKEGIKINYVPFVEVLEVARVPNKYAKYENIEIKNGEKFEEELFRQYVNYVYVDGKLYKIITRSSLIEKEDLFWTILFLMSMILSILLGVLFHANRKTLSQIFKPFYENLIVLKSYKIDDNSDLDLVETDIAEFDKLNDSLKEFSQKAKTKYKLLKEFSEEMNHELQTPVSVIKAKLELLLQKEINDIETEDYLQSIYQNINKLDKLNRTLLLLSKLENPEFYPSKNILVKEAVEKALENYKDIAELEKIKMSLNINSEITIEMNETLLEILLGNLLSNSVKHNCENGEVSISLCDNVLSISNTGEEPKYNPELYFNRFVRNNKSKESTGLGLSVAKKICTLYNFNITYTFEKPYHKINLTF